MKPRVAYVLNQYPSISHSFIRTEILALERQGIVVRRIAMRGWDTNVEDATDRDEATRTSYVLNRRAVPILSVALITALRRPIRFMVALCKAWRLSRGGDKGFLYHLIYLAEACWILRWLVADKISHVHAHFGSNATTVAHLIRMLGGPPYSFTVHGPEEFDKPLQLKLREKIAGSAFVVAISSFCRSQLFRWSDTADWHKIKIVHCSIDPRFEIMATTPPPLNHTLVCVGRLCEQKGQLLLVHVAAALRDRGVTAKLLLAGDGEMRNEIETAIAAAELEDRVEIVGWIAPDVVREMLEQSRALVLPSFGEGLPVVIMEAMARQRPVLSTYIAGIPELVRDGVEGILVPAGDAEALASAIERLLAMDGDELATLGEAARARVLERHASSVEAAKLKDLFIWSAEHLAWSVD